MGYTISQPPSGLEPLSSSSFEPVLENVGIERRKFLQGALVQVGVSLVEMVMGNHNYPKYIFKKNVFRIINIKMDDLLLISRSLLNQVSANTICLKPAPVLFVSHLYHFAY